MEVYTEVTYLVNALLILLSFEILCYLLNIKMNIRQLLLYVLSYNISILMLYIDFFPAFLVLYDFVLTLIYFKKLIYIYFPIYIFIYISLLSFLQFIMPDSFIFQGVLLIEGIHVSSFIVVGLFMFMICYLYISFCQMKVIGDELVDVCFMSKKCQGFIDNGNKVFYKGYPVIFISKHLMGEYEKIDTIEVETANKIERIDIALLDEIQIKDYKLQNVYIGVMSSNHYDCIIHSKILGGML